MMRKWRTMGLTTMGSALLLLAACGDNAEDNAEASGSNGNAGEANEVADNQSNGDTNATTNASDAELSGEIEFMTLSLLPAFEDYLNNMIADFEEMHPGVDVTLRDVPFEQAEQLVLTQASSGDLPDVMNLNTDFVKQIAAYGALVNMDEAAADVKDDFFEGLWTTGYVNGATYALPWYTTTSGLIYNPDILAEAGFDAPPSTYEEAWEMSQVIYETTGAYGEVVDEQMHMLLPKHDIPTVDEESLTATFNTPEAVELWTHLKEQYDAGLFPDDVMLGQVAMPELYAQERVAWWATGPQLFRQVNDLDPEVYEKSLAAPALLGPAGRQHANPMNISVSSSSDSLDAAVEFAKFVTNAENQLEFGKEASVLPSVAEAAEDPFFAEGEDSEDAMERGRFYAAQQLEDAVNMTPSVEQVSQVNEIIRDSFHRVILEDMDPQVALDQAEAEVNALLQ
ncbi:sugar ABC transporter substrate-binding protein [Paenalkalicoccus suaedae]|uniref:Sugar ABC transporter substrate-binding protein n=1 Tax=Paenalkalicoccus suaedae TaxID=2592382 RepID=A0A859FIV1_9BACI|nr:sugar ABC transporter substrate-binding protein [Paenalkalicoccus suaedae]QKS72848.1 sugar ABC transporter substrate-binding protein [Paenalkalicoccus suaedae]